MKLRPKHTWTYRVSSLAGKSVIFLLEQVVRLFIDNKQSYAPASFAWVKPLEDGYAGIRKEYDALMRSSGNIPDICDISEEQYAVIEREKWTFYPLYMYGIPVSDHLAECPLTAKAIESIPGMTTAFFSILKPGSYIQPHRGAYKGYLRYHMGIDIPQPASDCGIRLPGATYHWENGRSLIFDDTFMHDAWNKSDAIRTVLYVDFIRPMPAPLVWVSKKLTKAISRSPFIQNAIIRMRTHKQDQTLSSTVG